MNVLFKNLIATLKTLGAIIVAIIFIPVVSVTETLKAAYETGKALVLLPYRWGKEMWLNITTTWEDIKRHWS